MEQDAIYYLLKKVHEFYPVGMTTLAEYPGEKKIMEIIEKKINAMIAEEDTLGSALREAIKLSTGDYQLFDLSSRQFPCYLIGIFYEEDTSGDLSRRTFLLFTISLLCNCYTYFIHDYYRVFGQITFSQRRKMYPIDSVSLVSHASFEKIKPIVESVSMKIENILPTYKYVSHLQLFGSKVTGAAPYGKSIDDNPTQSYSIYHFLFDSYFEENPHVAP
ncbi:hypothetical protein [Chitinophaga terrae (ex Kim and Jung 2007)]|nr:hypothetical protein [Chitinophaga terrae (ex Kim and Jung 2007)]